MTDPERSPNDTVDLRVLAGILTAGSFLLLQSNHPVLATGAALFAFLVWVRHFGRQAAPPGGPSAPKGNADSGRADAASQPEERPRGR